MRIAVFATVLMLAAPADPAPRAPWLLFPIDVRRFDRVSSPFGLRRLGGHRRLHRGVDLVAPPGSWVVAARGTATDDSPAFVVQDGTYVSARWPGDAYLFAKTFLALLQP